MSRKEKKYEIMGSNLYPWQSSSLKIIVENNDLFLLSQKSRASIGK
jgi:hypothetical protein